MASQGQLIQRQVSHVHYSLSSPATIGRRRMPLKLNIRIQLSCQSRPEPLTQVRIDGRQVEFANVQFGIYPLWRGATLTAQAATCAPIGPNIPL